MAYTCKNYGYGNYTRMVRYYIKDLYDNSMDYYNKTYGDVNPTGTKNLDLRVYWRYRRLFILCL